MTAGRARGFTLLEVTLTLLLIATLTGLSAAALLRLEAQVERLQVQRTVAAIESALAMEFAARALEGRLADTAELERRNPLDWLVNAPSATAAGVFSRDEGGWRYDSTRHELEYRFGHRNAEQELVRFRVEVVASERGAHGARLRQLE